MQIKIEIRKIFCIKTIKSLKNVTTIYSSHYNNESKHGCNRKTQKILF